ncbi:SDR family oxidoreductase [Actinoplanes utahensis]|uniref:NAD-dependent dehydratase n=1 Tax=Actinoplanes utahensis TaxID=1869 RepID=A0A0A6UNU8_ACTUT|nr:SDR family oxidoreductase [Actinoplanes utahensis]KHD77111.1 NAD-dependent dehydratase [Actinoplanes utahensis]GIF33019.1 NAD(P)-dependent oxidoreductase [Actinoplanes utahensis]
MRCLVTGATGYIGGRLAPRLLDSGHQVRCLARSPGRLRDVPWAGRAEIMQGDLADPATLPAAFEGVDVAYFLMHSLGRPDFERLDREAARNFAAAARAAGVRRIIYLGGPEPPAHERPSAHLRSRAEVARILLDSGVPTAVLRAPVIIGSGSASFEMLRYLTERLPAMITPRWVHNRIQPVAVRDVLRYLIDATALAPEINRGFDIGGADVLTYAEMMQRYARVAGLPRRVILPTRVLSPWLSAHWVGLITPVPNAIARPLVASLVHEAIAHENDLAELLPGPPSLGFDESVRLALGRIRDADVETRWSTASGLDTAADPLPSDPEWSGGSLYIDERSRPVQASTEQLWRVIEGIGGENGWYSFPLAWSVRGWLDRLAGGVGLRRGRRDKHRLRVGEALDWWRVEEIEPGSLLRLRAEMRVPGRAWLEMRAVPAPDGGSVYHQRAVFLPRGLAGHLYWASVLPFHGIVFNGMARNITRTAASGP